MTFPIDFLTQNSEFFLLGSLLIGVGFGVALEKAGFGRSDKLAAQFYFRDMTVLKVMFTAIVTASIGLMLAGGLGVVDLSALTRSAASYTYVWPMLVGGLVLGVGFVIAGYCPGTSVVGAASGKIDGIFAISGVVIGSVIYGELYPFISDFAVSGNLEHFFLEEWLGVDRAVVVLMVTLVAIGAFIGAEKVEAMMARKSADRLADEEHKAEDISEQAKPRTRYAVFASLGTLALLGLGTMAITPTTAVAVEDTTVRPIAPHELATAVVEAPWTVRILDLRGQEAWTKDRIPGSEPTTPEGVGELGLDLTKDQRSLVLVGGEGLDTTPQAVRGYDGQVFVLDGGYAAWKAWALTPAEYPGHDASQEEKEAFAFRSAVHGMLTNKAAAPPPPPVKRKVQRKAAGGGGCN